MPYLDVPNARLYYEVDGEGRPIVLLHAGVANLRMWDEQIAPLNEAGWRVIRYDARGFGKTEAQDAPFSDNDDLRALLDHLGVTRAVVVGLSRGGQFAIDFTVENPARVVALVAAAPGLSGFDGSNITPSAEEQALWEEYERLSEAKDHEGLAELAARVWVDGFNRPGDVRAPDAVRAKIRAWELENMRKPIQPRSQPIDPPAAGRLNSLTMPVMVMIGTADEPTGILIADHVAAHIPGAQKIVFPHIAHMINMEIPAEFNQHLLNFLAQLPA